jgi:hypothetical protein
LELKSSLGGRSLVLEMGGAALKLGVQCWVWEYNLGAGYPVGYNEFDFSLEIKKYRPFDGSKIEI